MKRQFGIYLLLLVFLSSCKRKYTVEGDKVYFHYWNEGSGSNEWLLDSADGKTFKSLDIKCDCDFVFGKDNRHLFIDGELIRNIDPSTFRFIGNYVFRDKDSAYFFGFYNNINDCAIMGINPDKLKLIKYPWSKADNILIHGYDTLLLDDINNFDPIDEDWGKTKKYVIYKKKILEDADPETFKVINRYSGKDKRHTYEF